MSGGEITLDLTGYKDRMGERVAAGRYRVMVEDVEQDQSKQGNTMINMWLRIVGGEFNGSTIIDRLVITDKSLFRVVAFMQAIGLPTPKKRFTLDISRFKGKILDVDLEDGDPWNGRVKSEVRGYLKPKGSEQSKDLEDFAGTTATEEAFLASSEPVPTNGARKSAEDDSDIADKAVDLESLDLG